MEYQNITLSLPKEILRGVKHLAIEEQTSVSGLLTRVLEELVRREDAFSRIPIVNVRYLTTREGTWLGSQH